MNKHRANKLIVRINYHGESWVELRASNGQVLLTSAMYTDRRPSDNIARIIEEFDFETHVIDNRKN